MSCRLRYMWQAVSCICSVGRHFAAPMLSDAKTYIVTILKRKTGEIVGFREIAVGIYALAFVASIISILSFAGISWMVLGLWFQLLIVVGALVSFCGVLLAYWVYEDGKTIDELNRHHTRSEAKIEELKKEIQSLRRYSVQPADSAGKPSEWMREALEDLYRTKGFLNPDLAVEREINSRITPTKTREKAIQELYEEKFTHKSHSP